MIMSRCCCRAVRLKESWPNYFNQKDSDRKVQSGIRQTSESFRENCRKHGLIRNRIPPRTSQPGQKKRDLTVSGFVFALVLIGVILAANTEQPAFWLLIGPVPVAVLHTLKTFLATSVEAARRSTRVLRTGSDENLQPRCQHLAARFASPDIFVPT